MKRLLRDPAFLVLPLALFLLVFYLLPVVQMLLRSTGTDWSFRPFVDAFSSEVTLKVFWLTARIAVIVTVLTLALAYPLAYFIATTGERTAMVLLALVLVPFWTSILIRSYAWMVLLGQNGVVNGFLRWTGVIDAPVRMLNTTFAVYVGMVHVLLPFMVLPILSSLKAIDGRLVAAAENLGAGPGAVFRHVIVPLSMPGVLAGSVLVFVLSLGFYITPALVGGPSDMTVSMLIAGEVDLYRWDVASAIATALLIVTLVTLALFGRVVSLERIFGGAR
ncbi:ABC transporter permease [Paenirhodobacter populi]|uniref:ABC transporter permease n=1 Tax=Paenirhodobacter populi TaxID=2306993 RepID=A0A443J4U7_9RHOB|nr:ABC transporter permease [Sinirhodobacter populi]RWR15467.1 ABC transporter permease [Sinirhodobacter populi]